MRIDPGQSQAAQAEAAPGPRLGDLDVDSFRALAHRVADLMADYLATVEGRAVLPPIRPGELRAALAGPPPERPAPMAEVLADYQRLIEPNVTHWQHPGFLAYFPSTASAPGILGEMLAATLVANAMLWRTSPASTELEEVVVGWLRAGLGLPDAFDGMLNETASASSLIALAAARQRATGDAAATGLAGRPRLRIYASEEAHSSIDKAAMTLGLGREGVRRIPTDEALALRPDALEAAISADLADGWRPCAIVATVGTTSTTAIDPVAAMADIAADHGAWLHVDAAYAGVVALLPERRSDFAGWERADSVVVNPHKWLFTPLGCSLLVSRRMDAVRDAFSLVPEYLRTTGGAASGRDFNEYQPELGRRFRALKLWFVLRSFGLEGLRERIEHHLAMARELAAWVDAEPDAERLTPAPFGLVCFRWRPSRLAGRAAEPEAAALLDELNERLLARLNATGEVFLSHTRVRGRYALRAALGNLRTEQRHVERLWALVRELGAAVEAEMGAGRGAAPTPAGAATQQP